jgi:uncharacterized protein YbgA (DUF1722 family)/uncharacterized protein YbbK (DUF523 family)
MDDTIKIGVSACLLGEEVRFDGGHKHDRYLTGVLGRFVSYVPVCPEVECGMGIPRETLRLVGDPEQPRLVTTRTGIDHTERMKKWAAERLDRLEKEDLCGFVFKKDSPSSGMVRVKVYNEKGMPEKKGSGIFARAFMDRFPLIPTEEEGRLNDMGLRENFLEQVFTLKRWRQVASARRRLGALVDFHTRHKLLFLSHSQKHYREMGRLVAGGKKLPAKRLYDEYERLMLETLRLRTTVKKHLNVLSHLMGYFKKDLTADEKKELLELFEEFRKENLPLIVPVTLINHYVRKYRQPYLEKQFYLNPHPLDLKLRNHV